MSKEAIGFPQIIVRSLPSIYIKLSARLKYAKYSKGVKNSVFSYKKFFLPLPELIIVVNNHFRSSQSVTEAISMKLFVLLIIDTLYASNYLIVCREPSKQKN